MLDQDSLCYLVKFWRARAERAEAQAAQGGTPPCPQADQALAAAPVAAPTKAALTFDRGEDAAAPLPVVYQPVDQPDTRAELDEARQTIRQLQGDLRSAQAEVRWLEAKLRVAERQANAAPRNRDEARFQAVKREFARRYHPSTNPSEGLGSRLGEKAREAIFKDFWPMFEGSDDGHERSSAA